LPRSFESAANKLGHRLVIASEGLACGVDILIASSVGFVVSQRRVPGLRGEYVREQFDRPGIAFAERMDDQKLALDFGDGVENVVSSLNCTGQLGWPIRRFVVN
jgi:hypothetical protein